MFDIQLSNQAAKFIKKSDKTLAKRFFDKLDLLKVDPVLHDSKKILNEKNAFRVRVGGYRILYTIYYETKIIIVSKIDKRPRVYD